MSWKGLKYKGTELLTSKEWNTMIDALDELYNRDIDYSMLNSLGERLFIVGAKANIEYKEGWIKFYAAEEGTYPALTAGARPFSLYASGFTCVVSFADASETWWACFSEWRKGEPSSLIGFRLEAGVLLFIIAQENKTIEIASVNNYDVLELSWRARDNSITYNAYVYDYSTSPPTRSLLGSDTIDITFTDDKVMREYMVLEPAGHTGSGFAYPAMTKISTEAIGGYMFHAGIYPKKPDEVFT